jgi:hypothetical protein
MDGDMVAAVLELLATLAGSMSSVYMLPMVARVYVTLRRYQPALALVTRWQRAPPCQRCAAVHIVLAAGTVDDGRGRWRCSGGTYMLNGYEGGHDG